MRAEMLSGSELNLMQAQLLLRQAIRKIIGTHPPEKGFQQRKLPKETGKLPVFW
jgi:hypothetical protein